MKYTTPAERIRAEKDRRADVLLMREMGFTLDEIGNRLSPKVSRQAVHQMLKRYAAAVDRRKREA